MMWGRKFTGIFDGFMRSDYGLYNGNGNVDVIIRCGNIYVRNLVLIYYISFNDLSQN